MSQLLASVLVSVSASLIFLLGAVHLLYTFHGTKLHPRDADLRPRLEQSSLQLTRRVSMWKAWIGFNASHSYGALLFGSVYGYLAVAHPAMLFASPFLLGLGLLTLAGYLFLGVRYWFDVPLRGIVVSTAFYLSALLVLIIR